MGITERLEQRLLAGTLEQRRAVLSAGYGRPCAVVDDVSTRRNLRQLCALSAEAVSAWKGRQPLRPGSYQRALGRIWKALGEQGL